MKINMYPKIDGDAKTPRRVARVEVQLRGKVLRERLDNQVSVSELDFSKCYQCYRSILLKLRPEKISKIDSKDKALWLAAEKGVIEPEQLDARDSIGAERQERRRRMKRWSNYSLKQYKIRWERLLPETGPRKRNAVTGRLIFKAKKNPT